MKGKQLIRNSVAYKCVECGELIKQHQKFDLMQKARWKPTAISRDKYFRSYQFNSIYSLLTTWDDIVSAYIKCEDDENKIQVFVNHKLGLPYRVQAIKPKFANLMNLKGDYKQRDIPHGVLFLTFAVDVQKGSRTNPDYPPRLEMEVLGHGIKYRTWSIEYKKFIGSIDHHDEGAWLELQEYFRNDFVYHRDDGAQFKPVIGAIDIRRDPSDRENVYAISKEFPFCMPIIGFDVLKADAKKQDIIDQQRHKDYDKFRVKDIGDLKVIQVSTNAYKLKVYNSLRVERQIGEQKANFCEFPFEYDKKYFQGLIAEEMRVDKTFVLPSGKHNEPLDLRVYNLAAADVQLSRWVEQERQRFYQKYDREEVKRMVNSLYVLRIIEKNLNPK
jgi:phage terminase large subunit GpA-like protein